jgi:hypothetical protein
MREANCSQETINEFLPAFPSKVLVTPVGGVDPDQPMDLPNLAGRWRFGAH